MFLLLLMGLGAASVKAQVRIGGNTAPSAAAVLDLNASDAANIATGGLVLPRVDLKSNVMQLTTGVANQTGTMVYNVTTTLGRIGVYYWNGNSWVLASLPSATASDTGFVLTMTPSGPAWKRLADATYTASGSIGATNPTTWTKYTVNASYPSMQANSTLVITVPGVTNLDICVHIGGFNGGIFTTMPGAIIYRALQEEQAFNGVIQCYHSS